MLRFFLGGTGCRSAPDPSGPLRMFYVVSRERLEDVRIGSRGERLWPIHGGASPTRKRMCGLTRVAPDGRPRDHERPLVNANRSADGLI
jgi:hypothetical protein